MAEQLNKGRRVIVGARIEQVQLKVDGKGATPRRSYRNNVSEKPMREFDAITSLANAGLGRRILHFRANENIFSQGMTASSVFYLQKGHAKLTVVSRIGSAATIMLLYAGDFIGEESVVGAGGERHATCTAMSACVALKIERTEFIRLTHEEPTFSNKFLCYVLTRSMRTQADLIDHLFNNTERRLARILLLMADFGEPGEDLVIPAITQTALAEMIGTTRSRVNFFMNRFRKLGFIEYSGKIKVNKSLLNVILHDQPQRAGRSRETSRIARRKFAESRPYAESQAQSASQLAL